MTKDGIEREEAFDIRRLSLYNGEEAKNMPEGQIDRPANLDKWRKEIGSV